MTNKVDPVDVARKIAFEAGWAFEVLGSGGTKQYRMARGDVVVPWDRRGNGTCRCTIAGTELAWPCTMSADGPVTVAGYPGGSLESFAQGVATTDRAATIESYAARCEKEAAAHRTSAETFARRAARLRALLETAPKAVGS